MIWIILDKANGHNLDWLACCDDDVDVDDDVSLMLLELELITFCRVVVLSLCLCRFSRSADISGSELVTASEISGICNTMINNRIDLKVTHTV